MDLIKQVIFDIGNVLLDFKPLAYLEEKLEDRRKIPEVYRALFQSEEWILLDRGTISEDQAQLAIIERNPEIGELIALAFASWHEMLKPIDGTIAAVQDLKNAGYGVYYLSNFHMLAFEAILKQHSFFGLFDGGVVSCREKLIKPEEEIYRRILDRYDLKAEETVFIDDVRENVDGAVKCGIHAILFQNPEDCRKGLIDLGVRI